MKPEDDSVLPVVRASELDEPEPERRWLIDQLWARAGVGIIGGPPKCCKSWLGLDLAVSVASGTPCLDTFHVAEPGGSLVYMAEDAAPVVKQRLEGLCRHRGLELAALPIGVITAPSVRLDLPSDQRRLAATVRRHVPRLLLLDPFVRLHRINENQASDVAAVLGYLRELQRAYNLAVTVVHHARKNGGSASGSCFPVEHRAAAAPEPSTLALAGTDNDMHLAIVAAESQGDPHTPPATTDLDATVLEALRRADNRGLPRASLRAALRVRNQRLGEALMRLTASGHIARHGDAWVRLSIPVPPTIDTPPEPERECGVTGG